MAKKAVKKVAKKLAKKPAAKASKALPKKKVATKKSKKAKGVLKTPVAPTEDVGLHAGDATDEEGHLETHSFDGDDEDTNPFPVDDDDTDLADI